MSYCYKAIDDETRRMIPEVLSGGEETAFLELRSKHTDVVRANLWVLLNLPKPGE